MLKNRVIIIIFLSLILLGVLMRALSGGSILFSTLIYSPGQKMRYPGSRTPEDTVKSFYLSIDNGDYERSYSLILEPDWTEAPVSYRDAVEAGVMDFTGWTPEEEFVGRLRFEIGPQRSGITLHSVDARVVNEVEVNTYARTFGIQDLRSAYRVEASGNILGACSLFRWRKELTVLQVGRRYRVLLSGTKEPNSYSYQTWFAGFEKVGDIRAGTIRNSPDEPEGSDSGIIQPVNYGGAEDAGTTKIIPGCGCGGGS
jgi:hypothetical protein